jgi:CDP-diacylglycerol---serine O-phosphatidyltransferase
MAKNAVPNIFTFGNLACGIFSILMTIQENTLNNDNYKLACLFILLAVLIDRYDGRIARYLNVSSDIGKELDSLADLISFGVAPSILLFSLYDFKSYGFAGYFLVLFLPISGAYRLARFNSSDFNGVFSGIPITVTGMLIAVYVLISLSGRFISPITTIIFIFVLSYLMVSKLKFKKM